MLPILPTVTALPRNPDDDAAYRTKALAKSALGIEPGAGVIGLTLVQMARALGLTDITVTDVIDERLETARSLGATRTLNGKDVDVEATMRELTEGQGVPLIQQNTKCGTR